ncbi:hypothetical protein EL09_22785 [Salmonella enterica subsp. enterica]|nr:hypothetical protein [Salmonella enterica subsp. enterica]MIF52495.1 hypothetical protein [Salmonella enterica subsp. enterica]
MFTKPNYTDCYVEGRIIVTRHQSNTSQTVAILHQNNQFMLSNDNIIQIPGGNSGQENVAVIDVPDAANILDAISEAIRSPKPEDTTSFSWLSVIVAVLLLILGLSMISVTALHYLEPEHPVNKHPPDNQHLYDLIY